MRLDQSTTILPKVSLAPAAITTGNATVAGAIIDTQGFNSLTFVVMTGVVTDGTFSCVIYGDSASGMGTEVALTGSDLIGSVPAIAITDDGVCERVGVNLAKLAGTYRYFRLKLTQAGASTGGFVSHFAILGNPSIMPTTTP